jgi:hypothetical protein
MQVKVRSIDISILFLDEEETKERESIGTTKFQLTLIPTFLSHIKPSGLAIILYGYLEVMVYIYREQTCTTGALHALDHLAWG